MQGHKEFKPRLFYTLSLERLVPEDHELRRFAAVLGLDWLRGATADLYSHTGQPSVDPVVLIKMMLLTVLYNVRSERQLAKDMAVNLAYRWFLGYDLDEETPNHSVLSKARRRFGESLFVELFSRVVEQCREAGLVDGGGLYVDSTLVRADASRKTLVPVEEIARSQWDQLEQMAEIEANGSESRDGPEKIPSGSGAAGKRFHGHVDVEKIGQRRRSPNRASARWRSKTDPDATMHVRRRVFAGLSYKVHQGVSRDGVVTAVTVTNSATHDASQVPKLLDEHTRLAGKPDRVIGDSHYGTIDVLAYLSDQGIDTYIHPFKARGRRGFFRLEDFSYDRENDEYVCPEGARLRRARHSITRARVAYRASIADCDGCSSRSRCIMSKRKDATRWLSFYAGGYVERARELCSSERGLRELKLRSTVIEGMFGVQKSHHGLCRARYRRLWRVSIQAHLTATVMNLKKLVRAIQEPAHPIASTAPPGETRSHSLVSEIGETTLRLLNFLPGPAPTLTPA